MTRFLLSLSILLAFGAAARADPPPVRDWSKAIETVVVTAPKPGPLIWSATKGNGTVYLIGLVEPLPKTLAWNDAGVRDALSGAHELLLPARASAGLFDMLWLLAWNSDAIYLPGGTTLESLLPDDLRARFVADREKLHRDADRYSGLRPPLAALRLEGDFMKDRDMTPEEPAETLGRLAARLGVHSRPIADYEAIPMLKQLPKLSKAANEACVRAALDDIDALGAHAQAAADAWARGDLAGIEASYSEQRFESCIQAVPTAAALFSRAVNDSTAAVLDAVNRPGKTVMAISIGVLLRKDGLLDRLAAHGITVSAR